jgi:hypothetical protein
MELSAALLSIEKAPETGKRREFSSARAFERKHMHQSSFLLNAILTVTVLFYACPANARQPSTAPSPARASNAETHNKGEGETVFCLTASSSARLLDYKVVVNRLTTYLSGPYRVEFIRTPNDVVFSLLENAQFEAAEVLGPGCVAIVSVGGDGKGFTRVFRLDPERVAKILEVGGLTTPDFVEEYLLNYTGRTVKGDCILPTKTEIYEWDGKELNLAATASYDDRFNALSRLARARTAKEITLPCCGAPDCPGSQNLPRADTAQEPTKP